ncbi:MAG: hypothetical protein WBA77_05940 [Microcoleaceae cyanobacterium]
MQTANQNQLHYQLYCPQLPLAVYREVATHLRQVEGVTTQLHPMPTTQAESGLDEFDYLQSQVGSLSIQYHQDIGPMIRQQVDRILAYYSDRYGCWKSM